MSQWKTAFFFNQRNCEFEVKHNPKTATIGLDLATAAPIGKLNTKWKNPRQMSMEGPISTSQTKMEIPRRQLDQVEHFPLLQINNKRTATEMPWKSQPSIVSESKGGSSLDNVSSRTSHDIGASLKPHRGRAASRDRCAAELPHQTRNHVEASTNGASERYGLATKRSSN